MEYVNYIFALWVIGLLCLVLVRSRVKSRAVHSKHRYLTRLMQRQVTAAASRKRIHSAGSGKQSARPDLGHRLILKRELQKVPTPWGWSRHQELNGGGVVKPNFSAAMQSFTNRILRQKELVSSPSNNPRISDSFRALLEDRYGPVNRRPAGPIKYEKVKAPLLRDPSEPHDQMDNFGTGEAERIRQKVQRLHSMKVDPALTREYYPHIDLKDVKLPWGW